jgi:hypothetical protein
MFDDTFEMECAMYLSSGIVEGYGCGGSGKQGCLLVYFQMENSIWVNF